jgi:hypothetical protein
MTPEERTMLEDLADKVQKTQVPPKDPEAEDFIRKSIGSRPDALYLMTQTVLIQNMALEHAQQQIRELQERASQAAPVSTGTSFLGGAPGGGRNYSQYASQQQQSAPPPPPQYNAPSPAPPSPTAGGSFLRGAAQTAAGVAAGALAFEGIRSLFSHPGFGGYGGFGGGYIGAPMGETVIENNYYDQPAGTSQTDFQDQNQGDYQDQGNVQDVDDSGQFDDGSNFDDSGDLGDGGGFDDGGGSWT